jgi:hypothetical protein
MAYSCSVHFSHEFSYTTLFILNYQTKVINRLVFSYLNTENGFILNRKGPETIFNRGEDPGFISQTYRGLSCKLHGPGTSGLGY